MVARSLILLMFLVLGCGEESCPDVIPPMEPKPKMSNCILDDSLPRVRFRPVDRFGDTSNASCVAILNYYTKYIGNIYFVIDNDTTINITSHHYYNNVTDCWTSFLFFPQLSMTKDTIHLNNSNKVLFSFLDCDQSVNRLYLDTTKNNYFLFTTIDTANRFLTGEFFCQVRLDPKYGPPIDGVDVMRFCDGQIRLNY